VGGVGGRRVGELGGGGGRLSGGWGGDGGVGVRWLLARCKVVIGMRMRKHKLRAAVISRSLRPRTCRACEGWILGHLERFERETRCSMSFLQVH